MTAEAVHTNDAAVFGRFAALKEAFQRATGAAFTEVSAQEFEAYFPTLSEQQRAAVYDAYRQVLQLSRANSEAEYEDIVEECQLWTKLATLEQLCAEQGLSAAGGFSNGSRIRSASQPEAAAVRSRIKAMTAEKELLTAQLAKLTQQQAEVAAALETKKQQVAAAAAKYKAIPQQLGGIATAGHSWNTQKAVPAV